MKDFRFEGRVDDADGLEGFEARGNETLAFACDDFLEMLKMAREVEISRDVNAEVRVGLSGREVGDGYIINVF